MAASFNFKIPNLRSMGPTCSIVIKPSDPTIEKMGLEKIAVPFIRITGLIDTGASTTAVSQRVINHLRLMPRGVVKVYTSNMVPEYRNEFDISLEFDVDTYVPVLRVLNANLDEMTIDCLIGRDVLEFGTLVYNGPQQEVTLTF